MTNTHEPGVYVKGDQKRVAHTPSDAVALTFEGFKPVEEGEAPKSAPVVESTPAVPNPSIFNRSDKKD